MITLRRQIELETLFLLIIATGISVFFVTNRNNNFKSEFNAVSNASSMPVVGKVVSPEISVFSQISPDGSKKVVMKVTQNSDNTSTYEFSTVDVKSAIEQPIFIETLEESKNMTIPFNTWSPDNNYFFIQENFGNNKKVFVFKATGDQFTTEEAFLDVTDLFNKQNAEYSFKEATGWASESLIIFNTTKQDGAKGPFYWFEVPSKAIIQLSTEF